MNSLFKLHRVKTVPVATSHQHRSRAVRHSLPQRHFCARVVAAELAVLALITLGLAAIIALRTALTIPN